MILHRHTTVQTNHTGRRPGASRLIGPALALCLTLGACDGGSSSQDAITCGPEAQVCECVRQSDCPEQQDCVNNQCLPRGASTGAGGSQNIGTSTGTGAAGDAGNAGGQSGASTDASDSTTSGAGGAGGAGDDSGVVGAAVLLLLDRSTSATEGLSDDQSRWEAIQGALAEPGGAVAEYASEVTLGLLDYTGFQGATCPDLGQGVPLAANNGDAVASYISELDLPDEDKSETPTRQGIEAAVDRLSARSEQKVIVLITDGISDDTCTELDDSSRPSFDNSACVSQTYYAVQRAQAAGVRTYVLGISDVDDNYLQGVANAGVGQPVAAIDGLNCGPEGEQPEMAEDGGSAPFWEAHSQSEINEHLQSIFDTALGN